MNSAFGIKLKPYTEGRGGLSGELPTGERVHFYKNQDGRWCGELYTCGITLSERIGSSSPEACYRSLRGVVANLRTALNRSLSRGVKG